MGETGARQSLHQEGILALYKKGDHPDFDDPIILTKGRKGCTIESICNTIHKVLLDC